MDIDRGTSAEPELKAPVVLCTPDGRLNQAAVGWSRAPLHDCALHGSWGRRKRWDYWAVTGPGCVFSLVYANVDYLGLADAWFCDLQSRESISGSYASPLGRGMALPDAVGGGSISVDRRSLGLSIDEEPSGTRLRASFRDFEAELLVQRPAGHQSMSVVIPWSAKRFQFTNKDVARPAEGAVRWRGRTYRFAADGSSWGALDFGRGKWPYRTHWNWGAGAGKVGSSTVGVQLGGKWTVGTGMTENALYVDGVISKISEELEWTYDRTDWLRPWRIRTPGSDRVDLTFSPVYDKRSRLKLGVASSSVDQCFGTFEGTIVTDDGHRFEVGSIFGWAEEATWRW